MAHKQTQINYAAHPAAAEYAVKPRHLSKLQVVRASKHQVVYLRDGEVVLYKRDDSSQWQVRFQLYDRKWYRQSTKHVALDYAARAACEIYDEARFKEKYFIPQTIRRFADSAMLVLEGLRKDISAGTGKAIYVDYIIVIEKYLIPYFGKKALTDIDYTMVNAFEQWRNTKMKLGQVLRGSLADAICARTHRQSVGHVGNQPFRDCSLPPDDSP